MLRNSKNKYQKVLACRAQLIENVPFKGYFGFQNLW